MLTQNATNCQDDRKLASYIRGRSTVRERAAKHNATARIPAL
jgi:hypothetical protein